MEFEFEGRTEKEAIDKAAMELGLEKDDFDVEILETQKTGFFKKGYVRIKVHTGSFSADKQNRPNLTMAVQPPQNEFEQKMADFTAGVIERMGYPGKISILFREKNKLGIKIESSHSSILIGKKGKNLDALQLLLNIYAGRLGREDVRVILDTENYRIRREESLVRLAYNVAEKVRETRGSILLEPMNPFDRWLIHTTLNDIGDVETKSEGDGLYKQVRVYYRGLK
ncbi:MAG: protein jag [Treponema sp.]|nr:protein jag [Treponema sp.]